MPLLVIVLLAATGLSAAWGVLLGLEAYKADDSIWMLFGAMAGFFGVLSIALALKVLKRLGSKHSRQSGEFPENTPVRFFNHRYLVFMVLLGVVGVALALFLGG